MQKLCANSWCQQSFEVTPEDLAFYDQVSPMFGDKKFLIPPPTLCPECRQQRRASWRNERNLFKDSCDSCRKSVVSMHAPTSPFPVYCHDCWWGDAWDGTSYGVRYDPERSFFQQLHELRSRVPRLYLFNLHSENSEYTSHSGHNKNCYMGIAMGKCEDCYYGHWILESQNVVDSMYSEHCQLCYECSYCLHCFRSQYCWRAESCTDCLYCDECRGCTECIGCVQLAHKNHYILNEQVSEEVYSETRRRLESSAVERQKFEERYRALQMAAPRRFALQIDCVASTGDDLYHCKNVRHGFNCRDSEDSKYMYDLGKNHTSMDCYEHGWLVESRNNYELHAGMAGHHLLFCHICAESSELLYSDCCFVQCQHLFGCIGLKHRRYCILNTQYTKEEYEALVPTIIENMSRDREWGEFFPVSMSPFSYRESVAQEYFPLAEADIVDRGWRWTDHVEEFSKVDRVIKATEVPESIGDVSDDIVHWAITCEVTKRPFKIIKQELTFYRTMNIPIPRIHPDERHRRRMALRNPRKLWPRTCATCQKPISTSYSPERPERVVCEECYLKEVY